MLRCNRVWHSMSMQFTPHPRYPARMRRQWGTLFGSPLQVVSQCNSSWGEHKMPKSVNQLASGHTACRVGDSMFLPADPALLAPSALCRTARATPHVPLNWVCVHPSVVATLPSAPPCLCLMPSHARNAFNVCTYARIVGQKRGRYGACRPAAQRCWQSGGPITAFGTGGV